MFLCFFCLGLGSLEDMLIGEWDVYSAGNAVPPIETEYTVEFHKKDSKILGSIWKDTVQTSFMREINPLVYMFEISFNAPKNGEIYSLIPSRKKTSQFAEVGSKITGSIEGYDYEITVKKDSFFVELTNQLTEVKSEYDVNRTAKVSLTRRHKPSYESNDDEEDDGKPQFKLPFGIDLSDYNPLIILGGFVICMQFLAYVVIKVLRMIFCPPKPPPRRRHKHKKRAKKEKAATETEGENVETKTVQDQNKVGGDDQTNENKEEKEIEKEESADNNTVLKDQNEDADGKLKTE